MRIFQTLDISQTSNVFLTPFVFSRHRMFQKHPMSFVINSIHSMFSQTTDAFEFLNLLL